MKEGDQFLGHYAIAREEVDDALEIEIVRSRRVLPQQETREGRVSPIAEIHRREADLRRHVDLSQPPVELETVDHQRPGVVPLEPDVLEVAVGIDGAPQSASGGEFPAIPRGFE